MKKILLLTIMFTSIFMLGAQNRESDSLALVDVYHSLNGPAWENSESWLTNAPLDEWEGIFVQNDRVSKLELKNINAYGTFPTAITSLSELTTLELSRDTILGNIPPELVDLQKLTRLVLSNCGLSGELPNIFTQFPVLRTLILDRNQFTGTLPDFTDLVTLLYIDRNQFSGEIPGFWADKNVSSLNIQENNLTGNFDILSTWENNKSLILSRNDWDAGSLPEWLDDNPLLETFMCEECNLVGDIPANMDFSNSPVYRNMQLSSNDLSGNIALLFNGPQSEQNLYLRVRDNNFSGVFPSDKMNRIFSLDLGGNHFTSMTTFDFLHMASISLKGNSFNYERLMPIHPLLAIDTIGVDYRSQQKVLEQDTIVASQGMVITLDAGDSHSLTTYKWYRNNVELIDENDQILEIEMDGVQEAGIYYCRMQNADFPELELIRNSVTVMFDMSTNTEDIHENIFSISPNPAIDHLKISNFNLENNMSFYIYSMAGEIIEKGKLNRQQTIDIQDLSSGMHILVVVSENNIILTRSKFMKLP